MKIRRGSVRLTEQDLLKLVKKLKVKKKTTEQPVLATAK
tara:strand:- start:632 stop:748 length:117 start_codon:yes stop_codon:yes gene_type:complete